MKMIFKIFFNNNKIKSKHNNIGPKTLINYKKEEMLQKI